MLAFKRLLHTCTLILKEFPLKKRFVWADEYEDGGVDRYFWPTAYRIAFESDYFDVPRLHIHMDCRFRFYRDHKAKLIEQDLVGDEVEWIIVDAKEVGGQVWVLDEDSDFSEWTRLTPIKKFDIEKNKK